MKTVIFIAMLTAIGFLGFGQDDHPVSWKFNSEKIGPLTYKVRFEATVKAPYHIYPQESFDAGLGMPTEFVFVEDPNMEFIGKMEEKGAEQKEGESLAYYSKGATFTQTLKLKSDKKTTLAFTIKYMACTNEMCLPPSSKQFTLALNDQNEDAQMEGVNSANIINKQEAPVKYEDFAMPDTAGKVISSKVITSKSKYTFIDFWASWCVPCRAQGRELIPVYNKYKAKGFDVIGISLDTNPSAWKKAIQADGYLWTNVSDLKGFESAMVKKYGITSIPRNFLVDDKGVIVAMDLHGKELEEKLAGLLSRHDSKKASK